MQKDFEEFCRENIAAGGKIEFCDKDGKTSLRMEGSLPMLFHGACEIVKHLAIQEGKDKPGFERMYVEGLRDVVLSELEERLEEK